MDRSRQLAGDGALDGALIQQALTQSLSARGNAVLAFLHLVLFALAAFSRQELAL